MRRNNLREYKRRQLETNKKLVQRAIDYLKKVGGNINVTSVSRTTYEIADASKGEKGLTAAALSKNKLYKNMILGAKSEFAEYERSSLNEASVGDLRLRLHQERAKNEELRIKIKILEDQLSKVSLFDTQGPVQKEKGYHRECTELQEENKHLKSLLKGIIQTLAKLELVENVDGDIRVTVYGTVILNKENARYLE